MAEPQRTISRAGPLGKLSALVALVVIALAFTAGCTGIGNGNPRPAAAAIPSTNGSFTTIELVAENMTFYPSVISVPSGSSIVVDFHNREPPGSSQVTGIAHNFAVYDSPAATTMIFSGEIITGGSDAVYRFSAPMAPGTYYFQDDVQPTMNGQFIVT